MNGSTMEWLSQNLQQLTDHKEQIAWISFKVIDGFIWMFPKMVGFLPKSSILIGFSIINHPFWGTPIFGKTHILLTEHWAKFLLLRRMSFHGSFFTTINCDWRSRPSLRNVTWAQDWKSSMREFNGFSVLFQIKKKKNIYIYIQMYDVSM